MIENGEPRKLLLMDRGGDVLFKIGNTEEVIALVCCSLSALLVQENIRLQETFPLDDSERIEEKETLQAYHVARRERSTTCPRRRLRKTLTLGGKADFRKRIVSNSVKSLKPIQLFTNSLPAQTDHS